MPIRRSDTPGLARMNERRLPTRRFDRRPICLALIGALIFAPHASQVAHALERGMLEFVRELYARETERHNARAPISEEAFLALFARDMRGLMQAPRSGCARFRKGHRRPRRLSSSASSRTRRALSALSQRWEVTNYGRVRIARWH